jgi:chromosome segregation ATPase
LHPATKSLPLDQPIDQEALKSALKSQLNELKTLKTSPPPPLLAEQLKEKQAQIEQLRKALEAQSTALNQVQTQLDQSLEARHHSLKVFSQAHEKRQQAQQELDHTIEEASEELVKGDQTNSTLRTQLFQAHQQISRLQRELNLARLRQHSPSPRSPSLPHRLDSALNYTQYALYA